MASVEGRIEAGNLRQLRLPRQNRAYGGEVVRLMKGSERYQALERLHDLCGHQNGRAVVRTAMDNPMADCRR